MDLNVNKLNTTLYDKKVRAEIRKNPRKFIDDDSSYKGAEEYKVISCSKEIAYIAILHNVVPSLKSISTSKDKVGFYVSTAFHPFL